MGILIEDINVPQQTCLYVFVVDTSSSMNECNLICKWNEFLLSIKQVVRADADLSGRIEIALITFNKNVTVVSLPALFADNDMPSIHYSDSSEKDYLAAIRKAQEIIHNHKEYNKNQGIPYYRPKIILISDFLNLWNTKEKDQLKRLQHWDYVEEIVDLISLSESRKEYSFYSINCGKVASHSDRYIEDTLNPEDMYCFENMNIEMFLSQMRDPGVDLNSDWVNSKESIDISWLNNFII